ncbi:MAG: Uma2 family endonuclease [Limnoraphis robusta]|jgi:Uma2 family endonuclease
MKNSFLLIKIPPQRDSHSPQRACSRARGWTHHLPTNQVLGGSGNAQGSSIPLIVEVVSTNWRDDYAHKMIDYEALGIPEYWIVDYLGLGGRRYIGSPKQPTLSVYQLVEGEYKIKLFRDSERVESAVFPEFNLTAKQIFEGE